MSVTTRLIHGDCLQVMPTLAPGSVAMVFADLPYAMTHHAYDVDFPVSQLTQDIRPLLSIKAPLICSTAGYFTFALHRAVTIKYRYDLIWRKSRPTGFLTAKKMPMRAHEQLLIFCDDAPTYNPQKVDVGFHGKTLRTQAGKPIKIGPSKSLVYSEQKTSNFRYPTSVVDIASVWNGSRLHPAQKPVALLEWLIKTYTHPGDTVLDPCAGSFTTGVACLRTGRNFIGVEKDATYFALGQRRIAEERAKLGMGKM